MSEEGETGEEPDARWHYYCSFSGSVRVLWFMAFPPNCCSRAGRTYGPVPGLMRNGPGLPIPSNAGASLQ
jgi:hypothetical protein